MNAQWRRRTERLRSEDAGLGLILVIGVSVFVFIIAATAIAVAVNAMSQSRQRTTYEVSLAVAETGIDRTLADVQGAYTNSDLDAPAPSLTSSWCNGAVVNFPPSGDGVNGNWSTEDAERTWARGKLNDLVTSGTCVQNSAEGQYVVLKPPGRVLSLSPLKTDPTYGRVYALSAVPSFAHPTRTRLVKSEYIFMPYRPLFAVLAGGPLSIDSSVTIQGLTPALDNLAGVHTNATLTGTGNPKVTGLVTSTSPSTFISNRFSSNPGGSVSDLAPQPLPVVSALQFYGRATGSALASWYDLCSGGVVLPYSPGGPCTADPSSPTNPSPGTASSSIAVRGWNFDSSSNTWIPSENTLPGTYYANQANVDTGTGNTNTPIGPLTVIASAKDPDPGLCSSKQYGNINWNHYDLTAPAYPNIWLFADSDLVTTANLQLGSTAPVQSGMLIAGDQAQIETSSSSAVGSIVMTDKCQTPPPQGLITTSEIKNSTIYFDPDAASPFASVITTSLWLDYAGS